MNTATKIILFLFFNLMGFMAVPICAHIALYYGLTINDRDSFQGFAMGTYMTWMICALFSLAWFFLKGNERYAFLVAPFIVPMAYGLYVIFRFFTVV